MGVMVTFRKNSDRLNRLLRCVQGFSHQVIDPKAFLGNPLTETLPLT